MSPVKGKLTDVYANKAVVHLTMSAANTLTFSALNLGISITENKAVIMHKINIFVLAAIWVEMAADSDRMYFALTLSDKLSSIQDLSQASILAGKGIQGVGPSVELVTIPVEMDFVQYPGGGLIMPAQNLFMGMNSVGLTTAGQCYMHIYYTIMTLTDKTANELVRMLFPANL